MSPLNTVSNWPEVALLHQVSVTLPFDEPLGEPELPHAARVSAAAAAAAAARYFRVLRMWSSPDDEPTWGLARPALSVPAASGSDLRAAERFRNISTWRHRRNRLSRGQPLVSDSLQTLCGTRL